MESAFRAQVVSGRVRVRDAEMIKELDRGGFGEIEDGVMFLEHFESLYLLYTGQLEVTRGAGRLDFEAFLRMSKKRNPEILTKFLIYRDLRTRGYTVKDGFGFGSDFRVYERGQYRLKGAKFLVFGLGEGQQVRMGEMHGIIQKITLMEKEPIIAVVERRGEVIYYRIKRFSLNENRRGLDPADL